MDNRLSPIFLTTRRWSDAGLPPCYRIGRRRHRRFQLPDLQDYLAGSAVPEPVHPGQALGFGGLELPGESHATHLYADLLQIPCDITRPRPVEAATFPALFGPRP